MFPKHHSACIRRASTPMFAYAEFGSATQALKKSQLSFLRFRAFGVFFATHLCRYTGQPKLNAFADLDVSSERAG